MKYDWIPGTYDFFIANLYVNVAWVERLPRPWPHFVNRVFISVYAEFFLIFALTLLIAFLVIYDYIYKYKLILSKIAAKILVVILILMLFLINNIWSEFNSLDSLLYIDPLSIFVKNILVLSLIGVILMSIEYLKFERIVQYEYFILVGLSLLGMFTLVSSYDLISMYMGIELQSLAFYVLATIKIYSNYSTEAGLKYFILGAFSSGLLLFGSSFIYGSLGDTSFANLKWTFGAFSYFDVPKSLILGIIFVLVAIFFKLGVAPFHMWLPDVYEGVPTIVTALYSIVPKIALFTLLLRLYVNIFYQTNFFISHFLLYCGLLSILIGTLGALYQVKFKRMLAYSAISHVGFLLIGFYSFDVIGLYALFFYLIVYIIISINIFTFLLVLRKVDNNLKIKKINEIVVLFKSNPLLAINFAIILFSIAGIPPLAGFYSKYYIFFSTIKSEVYIVGILAAIFSVIASMYYIRLIKLMFFKTFDYWVLFLDLTKRESLLLSLTFFFNIVFFCYPEIITLPIYNIILHFIWW